MSYKYTYSCGTYKLTFETPYTFMSYYTGNCKLLFYKYKRLQTFANWRSCTAETTIRNV